METIKLNETMIERFFGGMDDECLAQVKNLVEQGAVLNSTTGEIIINNTRTGIFTDYFDEGVLNMDKNFIEDNYFDFLNFKSLRSEVQTSMNDFCSFYLENYKGTNKDNIESLRLFFNKFLKDNHKDSIFLCISQNSLKICIYDSNIDFLRINESLDALKDFINEFKDFLNE